MILMIYGITILFYTISSIILMLAGTKHLKEIKKNYPKAHWRKSTLRDKIKVYGLAFVPALNLFFGLAFLLAITDKDFMEEVCSQSIELE